MFNSLPTSPAIEQLKRLAQPENALECGKAAEHLVVADLIISGHRAYLTDQGLPYDVVVDIEGRLSRIQVKATCFPKNVNSQGRVERNAYSWNVRRRGKGGSSRLDSSHCDLVALVALDVRAIAYIPISVVGETVQLFPRGGSALASQLKGRRCWGASIDDYPLNLALAIEFVKPPRPELTHCMKGHELTSDNKMVFGREIRCRECHNSRRRMAKQHLRGENV